VALVLGLNAKLYISTTLVTPVTWDLVSNCKDLTLTMEKNTADVTVRGTAGWRAIVAVLKDATVEFKMQWDTSDPNFTIIQDAFFSNSTLNVQVMDGDNVAGPAQGLQALCMVVTFTRNEPLEEALNVDVQFKPTYSLTTPPVWVTVP
jgi:predicted secreted protein